MEEYQYLRDSCDNWNNGKTLKALLKGTVILTAWKTFFVDEMVEIVCHPF